MTSTDTRTADLIEHAANAAWGHLPDVASVPPQTVRAETLSTVFRDLQALAPDLGRDKALALGCLLVDVGLAIFHGKKFMPGALSRTPGTDGMSSRCALSLVERHTAGDWGDMSDDDKAANEVALAGGGRILSCYKDVRDGSHFWVKVWVMTEADAEQNDGLVNRLRLQTTVLLPSEY